MSEGKKMRILKVIHGYPPMYNAGSEVYSQTLCHELSQRHQVEVFTRFENPLLADYYYFKSSDQLVPKIAIHNINLLRERNQLTYEHHQLDQRFAVVISQFKPDIIHIGHLNHLSLSMVDIAYEQKIPMVYTLHDYWLMCPRGQLIQRNSSPPFAICAGPEPQKCAAKCYSGLCSSKTVHDKELTYWSEWLDTRTQKVRAVCEKIDHFIAPSRYLLHQFANDYIPEEKISFLDYGFNRRYLNNRKRHNDQFFTFGYIGTHIPAKGIQDLIQAFVRLPASLSVCLKIWGRFRSDLTPVLMEEVNRLPHDTANRIHWMGEYTNHHIVPDVLNHVDAIVVPSIWVENSPLVIHEAQEVGVPVITANMGGMAEYVHHGVNGLLFQAKNIEDLSQQMAHLATHRDEAITMGARGYLYSLDGKIPDIQLHATALEHIYKEIIGYDRS